jgi:hypothetical protein
VDQQARVCTSGLDLVEDAVERERAVREVATEHHAKHAERCRQPARDDDLAFAELRERQRLACNDDRPVARPDRRTVRQQVVAVLHERVRRERERGDFEPSVERPLVEHLDVLRHELELEPACVDVPCCQAPDHERVVGVGGMPDPDQHGPQPRLCAWPSRR